MALVMLPCDLPWWGSVSKHLTKLTNSKNTHELIEGMQKIHDMCCISLDPDEEPPDPEQFIGLLNFLDNDLNSQDRSNFFNKTLPAMVKRALQMKDLKPRGGLHFSLQQQPDFVELPRAFVSSLLANAFFSTFPKRTSKSHPTLQNFNFSYFFKYLSDNVQKSKLRGILQYFDWLEIEEHANGTIKFLRQVMSSKEWLTIEDWLECTLPLCPLQIRHHGRMEKSESDALHMCFSSAKIGGSVLENGQNQECVNLCTIPEILSVLLNVESLEDNEVFRIENVSVTSRIIDPKNRANFEKNESPDQITVCCVDAEDYSKLPLGQYEEDNVLRELNKCLLAFQQKQHKECHPNITVTHSTGNPHPAALHKQQQQRRLSPIGESMGSNSDRLPIITRQSCSTKSGGSVSFEDNKNNNSSTNANSNLLAVKAEYTFTPRRVVDTSEAAIANRRGRFIILGSSGECLPVKRIKSPAIESSLSSSLDESEEEDEFHSARSSLEDVSEDEDCHKRYSVELDTKEHRSTFAKRLQDALRRENSSLTTESVDSESSYAVGISVTGSGLLDQDIKVRRRGSTGFLLQEESLDEDFLNHSLQQEQQWIDKFKSKQTGLSRKESNKSSEYSFSTDYSGSELEEVYEQFSRWLENPLLETEKGKKRQLDARDLAVVQFAGSLLKRTLSESFAGVPIMDGCEQNSANTNPPEFRNDAKHKLVLNAKSLSLELARHKHKLAAQLAEYVEPNVLAEAAVESPVNKETPNIVVPTVSDKSCEGQSNAVVTKRVRPRLNWVATTVTAVVQTLEDICVNVSLPLSKPEAVTQVTLSQITLRPKGGIRPISTGNWGCGTSKRGDVQLKVLIQWMAASVAGTPSLIYYTYGHKELATLDTLCRLLIDRRWSVKDLTRATLRFASRFIHDGGTMENGGDSNHTLFEELIGVDRTS